MKKIKRVLFGEDVFPSNSIWVIGISFTLATFAFPSNLIWIIGVGFVFTAFVLLVCKII